MPYFTFYSSPCAGTDTWATNDTLTAPQVQQKDAESRQSQERQKEVFQRLWEKYLEDERQEAIKKKQRAEDKVKFPLFFLKEGII